MEDVAEQHAGEHGAPDAQVAVGHAQHHALVEGEEEVGGGQLVEDDLDFGVVVREVGARRHDGEVEEGRARTEHGAVEGAEGLDVEVPEAVDGGELDLG